MNGLEHEIDLKEERYNEFGSVKDRVAWYVLNNSAKPGEPVESVIDASSGNYGYALSRIGERLGISVSVVSSPSISEFNAAGIRGAGARLIIAEARDGESANAARMRVAGEIATTEGSLFLDQYRSLLNPASHQEWTATELFSEGEFNACFVAASSGGTARGFADFLAANPHPTELVLVDPYGSRSFEDPGAGDLPKLFIPGYGSGRASSFSNVSPKPSVRRVSETDVLAAFGLFEQLGLPGIGLSSIGVVLGALDWLAEATEPQRVVCVCADGDDRYRDEFESRYLPKIEPHELQTAIARLKPVLSDLQTFTPLSDQVSVAQ